MVRERPFREVDRPWLQLLRGSQNVSLTMPTSAALSCFCRKRHIEAQCFGLRDQSLHLPLGQNFKILQDCQADARDVTCGASRWLMQAAEPGSRTCVDVAVIGRAAKIVNVLFRIGSGFCQGRQQRNHMHNLPGASVAGYCAWRLEGDLQPEPLSIPAFEFRTPCVHLTRVNVSISQLSSPVLYVLSLAVEAAQRRRGHAAERHFGVWSIRRSGHFLFYLPSCFQHVLRCVEMC